MNISPLSFKGLITVQTRKSKDEPQTTEVIRTTKKQDGEILSAFVSNTKTIQDHINQTRLNKDHIGYGDLENIYGRQTALFHKTLESIIKKEIPQPSLGDPKRLHLGGFSKRDYSYPNKYDTSYNKIYYGDAGFIKYPSSSVVVDLMEPKERKTASEKRYIEVKEKLAQLTDYRDLQLCMSPDENDHSKNPENYAKIEEKMSIVLAQLDGHLDGPDFREHTKDFGSPKETYKELAKSLKRTMGITPHEREKTGPGPKVENLSQSTVDRMRRAIHVLNN